MVVNTSGWYSVPFKVIIMDTLAMSGSTTGAGASPSAGAGAGTSSGYAGKRYEMAVPSSLTAPVTTCCERLHSRRTGTVELGIKNPGCADMTTSRALSMVLRVGETPVKRPSAVL